MQPHYEKVPRDRHSAFHLIVRNDPSFQFNWHFHPEFELTLIVDSVGQRLVGNGIADYQSGDLVLLGPNLPHSWRSVAGPRIHRAIVVQFHRAFLGDSFFQLKETAPLARLLDRSGNGLAFGQTTAGRRAASMLAELPAQSPPDRLLTFLCVLRLLSHETKVLPLSLGSVRPTYRLESQHRIDTICAYLEAHCSQQIDFRSAAHVAHMDQASLCRFFKQATGRTMTTYVNELRVAAATQLLLETNLNVIDIGCRVGFYNSSNFNRQFKHLKGMSPGAVREKARRYLIDTEATTSPLRKGSRCDNGS